MVFVPFLDLLTNMDANISIETLIRNLQAFFQNNELLKSHVLF